MTPLVRRIALPLSLSVAAATLVALPAAAVPTWVPALQVQNDGLTDPSDPVVAVDAEGAATMLWLARADSDDPADTGTVRASTHPVGGAWSAPQDLSAFGAVEGELDLAVDAAGNAVAVWTQDVGTPDQVIQYRTRTSAGAWSSTDTLSDLATDSSQPSVGIDAAGNAVAVWVSDAVDSQSAIVGRAKSLAGGWSPTFPLSDPENGSGDPMVTVAPDGRATVVWAHYDTDLTYRVIETASRGSATDDFDPFEVIPTTSDAQHPSVAVNAAGAAVAAWEQRAPDVDHRAVHAATRTPVGVWSGPAMVSEAPDPLADQEENGSTRVVVDAAGTPTVVWRRSFRVLDTDPRARTIETASAVAGVWTDPASLGASSDGSGLELVIDAASNLTAVWPSEGGLGSVAAARRAAGAAWGAPIPVGTTNGRTNGVAAAASPAGDVVVGHGFRPLGVAPGILYARAFDVDGPLARSLSVPGAGAAGQAASYSVTAVDAWSPISLVVWSFGDGTMATGTNLSHTYAAAGSYSVRVTATDAIGNSATWSGSTVVAAAPVVTPPPPPTVTSKPALTGVKLTKKTIHVVKSDESPRSTNLKLTLNTDSAVKVVLKRTKKVDGKAVKATLTKALKKGAAAVKLTSKVGNKLLSPGTYKVTVTGKNTVGTSVAVVVKLKILA